MTTLTLGSLYVGVASRPLIHNRVLLINIPLRLTAMVVFWRDGPEGKATAIYEGVWALLNAAALLFS